MRIIVDAVKLGRPLKVCLAIHIIHRGIVGLSNPKLRYTIQLLVGCAYQFLLLGSIAGALLHFPSAISYGSFFSTIDIPENRASARGP
jgi:hypothetical protein